MKSKSCRTLTICAFVFAAFAFANVSSAALWSDCSGDENGWKESSWFGWFSSQSYGQGWLYHGEHEWMFAYGDDDSNIWFWYEPMGWLWTSNTTYPFLWSDTGQAWLWYYKGTGGWFLNFKHMTSQWRGQYPWEIMATLTDDPDYGAIAEHPDGEWMAVMTTHDEFGNITGANGVVYTHPNGVSATIYLGEDGLPERMVQGDYVIIFSNYTEDSADIALISPNGEVTITRDVSIEPGLLLALKNRAVSPRSARSDDSMSLHDVVEVGLFTVDVAVCVVGIITTPAGIGLVGVAAGCGGTLLTGITITQDNEGAEIAGTSLGTFSCALSGFSDYGLSCLLAMGGIANDLFLGDEETQAVNEEVIAQAITELEQPSPGPAPGAKLWEFATGGSVFSSPAIGADGTVYAGSWDNKVYALDGQTGARLWEFVTGGGVYSSPAIGADGTVYVGSRDNKVYALDGSTGAKLWEFATGHGAFSSPAIGADGTVYVGSYDNKVYALDGQTGAKLWEFATGSYVFSSPAIGADGTVYVGSCDNKVYALDGSTGAWLWEFATGSGVYSSPAIGADGTVYVGSYDNKVYALDGQTGARLWEFATGGGVGSSPAIGADGTVYVGSYDNKVYALKSASLGLADSPWPKFRANAQNTGNVTGQNK